MAEHRTRAKDPNTAFLRRSIELALEGVRTNQGGPFGALVVKDGAVIGEGFNRVLGTNDPTAHAEIVAIRAASARLGTFELAGCELYTSCEPCPMCLAAAYWARVDRVHYACDRSDAARAGFDDNFMYEELVRAPAERKLPVVQALRDEGLVAFQAWMDKADRTPY
jgi:tRNA(Arg) A34 adenosine deaminase TadA